MLPNWITAIEGSPGHFIVDPDGFYPQILKDMGVEPKDATRYDMEVALGFMKKDVGRLIRMAGLGAGLRGITLIIRGDEGRKATWAIAGYPVGAKEDISPPHKTKERNRAIAETYRRIRGG
jgi:hypothetical protein